MKKIISKIAIAATLLAPIALALPAQAVAPVSVGNPAVDRATLDTYSSFTIIDTNNPVSANGWLTNFSFFTKNQKPFEFVLVDGGNIVKWVSAKITPATIGLQTYGTVVPVQAGWNLGVHFDLTGTIPFDGGGAPAAFTPNNNGMPVVGLTLNIQGTDNRVYSWGATGTLAATCSSVNLASGTASQQAGFTETNPVATPLVPASYSHPYAAAFASPTTVIPPWINPATDVNFSSSGAVWVSSAANWPGDSGGEGLASNDQWRLFQDSFNLPAGAVVSSADVWYTADNAAAVYQNGTFLDRTGGVTDDVFGPTQTSPFVFESVFHDTLTPTAGSNTLNFVLRNWGGPYTSNPTGLLYKAVVNYCVPNAAPVLDCPAAPSIAAAYLQNVLHIKAGSATFKNIISLVAQHMGPQTDFDGIHACQTGYNTVVDAYALSKVNAVPK